MKRRGLVIFTIVFSFHSWSPQMVVVKQTNTFIFNMEERLICRD